MDKQRLIPIGIKEGMVACVSKELLAQHGEHDVKELLGITGRHFPVQTSLRGDVVMVEADSQEEAERRYLAQNSAAQDADSGKPFNGQKCLIRDNFGDEVEATYVSHVWPPTGAFLTGGQQLTFRPWRPVAGFSGG